MVVNVFIPASAIGLSINPLIAFRPGSQLRLPDGCQAKVIRLHVEESGCVLRCEVDKAAPSAS
jgi:hypothetical protein